MVNEYKAKSTCKVKKNDTVYMNFIDTTGQRFSSSPAKSSANITNVCDVSLSWWSDSSTRQKYSIDNRNRNGSECSFEELSGSNGAMKRTVKIPSDVQGNQSDFVLYVNMYAAKDANSTNTAPVQMDFPQCADIQLINDYSEPKTPAVVPPKTPPVIPSRSIGRLTKNFSK